ncbi:flagellar hook protein FlgE [Desulfothermus naphthae]
MSLGAALYAGTSGLEVHGEKMNVIGHNLANVGTIGYKASRMDFEDAMYQSITTASGADQVGRGASISAVLTDFSQGSMESTNVSTDLAINGKGFFIVSPKGEELEYYTRAGNFRFDKEGYLVDPHAYVLQGWRVEQENIAQAATTTASVSNEGTSVNTVGSYGDIRLENFQSPPQATQYVQIIANLNSQSEEKAISTTDPFFAMFEKWDATQDPALGDNLYSYQTTLKVYDENGSPHDLTVYFDKVEENVSNTTAGYQYWEYMVTVNPDEDNRSFWSATDTKKGILMIGTLTFDSAGNLIGQSAYTIQDAQEDDPSNPATQGMQLSGDPNDLNTWTPAQFNIEGYPILTANFLGNQDADATNSPNAKNIALDFGAYSQSLAWTSSNDASTVGTDASNLPTIQDMKIGALSVTSYSSPSTTYTQAQDGYPAGDLESISVNRDGVITGHYSNGQVLDLYVITLANFNNPEGLRREGGNLFIETKDSGTALTGLPTTAGLGSIASNSLEQSNVDMAEEFVKMITTQKGFQANARTITTTNTLLDEVIRLGR